MVLQPHPILFFTAIGTVYTHGFFFAMGALVGVSILLLQRRFLALRPLFILERSVWIFLIGLLAARVGYFITYPSQWVNTSQLLTYWQGGLVSYWGMVGGLFVVLLSGRRMAREQRWRWYGAVTVATLLAWSVGRIGNYYAADSIGVLSPFWHLTYGRVPIQLMESVLCLILGIVGWIRLRQNPELVVWTSWLGYFLGRTVIDTWRDEGTLGVFHVSQLTSFTIAVVIMLMWRYYGHRPTVHV